MPDRKPKPEHRVERYTAVRDDGSTVTVEHDLETGETRIVK